MGKREKIRVCIQIHSHKEKEKTLVMNLSENTSNKARTLISMVSNHEDDSYNPISGKSGRPK